MPMALAVDGANRHDKKLVGPTLDGFVIERPTPTRESPQNLSGDKGYDYPDTREETREQVYIIHIRARGEEIDLKQRIPGYRCRRWVVERTHSWLNRFRRILIRWEKQVENYVAMLHFACGWICFRGAGLFG